MRRKKSYLPNPFTNPFGFYYCNKEETEEAGGGGGEETKETLKDKDLAAKPVEKVKFKIGGVTQELTALQAQQLIDLGVEKYHELQNSKQEPEESEEKDTSEQDSVARLEASIAKLQERIDKAEEKGRLNERKQLLKKQVDLLLDSKDVSKGSARNVIARLTLGNIQAGADPEEAYNSAVEEFGKAVPTKGKKADSKDVEYVKDKLKDAKETEVDTDESGGDVGLNRKKPYTAAEVMDGTLRRDLINQAHKRKMKA